MAMMPPHGGVRHRTCRLYWCYECGRALRIISYPTSDVFCPRCYGRFLHEIDPPPRPALPPPHFFPRFPSPFPPHDGPQSRWVIYGGGPTAPAEALRLPAPESLPPRWRFPSLQPGPVTVPPRRRLPSPPPPPVTRRPATPPVMDPGDYFTGPNLNTLIEELSRNDLRGPAPAASSAIDSLPTVRISAAHLSDGSQCPVCKEDFELGEAARELPCKHVYHSDCIVPWLRLHNSCPVCRCQLARGGSNSGSHARRSSSSSSSSNSGGGGDGASSRDREPPTIVRWGPMSWLWPPRGLHDDDGWGEYGRRGRNEASDDGGAGGNDNLTALQSFVLVTVCVFFFSFFV